MSMAPPEEYEDDAARIDREYIPDRATTEAEIEAALKAAGFPSASQSAIQDWMVSQEDAWDTVGPKVKDADSVRREIESQSSGTVSDGRAQQMAEEIASEITSARGRAARRAANDDGQVRTENGQFLGKLQNVEEVVREDGIYFRNENTGTEGRAARFDR